MTRVDVAWDRGRWDAWSLSHRVEPPAPGSYPLAHTAGIVDGEGHLAVIATPWESKDYHRLQVVVTNTDHAVLEPFERRWGGASTYNEGGPFRPSWRWACSGMTAAELARDLLPYSVTKKEVCRLACAFGQLLSPCHSTVTDENIAQRRRLAEQMAALKGEEFPHRCCPLVEVDEHKLRAGIYLEWAAGFADAEGLFRAYRSHRAGRHSPVYEFVVRIANVHLPSLVLFRSVVSATLGRAVGYWQDVKPTKPQHRWQYQLVFSGQQAVRVARLLHPHLTTKQTDAEYMLLMDDLLVPGGRGKVLTSKQVAQRDELLARFGRTRAQRNPKGGSRSAGSI